VRDVFINNKVNTIVDDKLDVNRISGERDLTFTTVNNFDKRVSRRRGRQIRS